MDLNSTGSNAWRILLVENDEDDYLLARAMLGETQGTKFILEWEASYSEGIEKLTDGGYDAALIDYDLAPYTGIDLIREANRRGVLTAWILFSGRGMYEAETEALQAGASLFCGADGAYAGGEPKPGGAHLSGWLGAVLQLGG